MLIKSITLTNFRNHANYHLDFKPTTTLIIGENGCGKTSVLEAIYILAQGKSFRSTDSDILRRGANFYRIELNYYTGETVTAIYDGTTKTFLSLDKKTKRLPKKAKYPIILFEPSDLNLVSGSPSRHRDYFNRCFGQLNESYAMAVSRYDKALKQRNELLKQESLSPNALFPWNILLARYGALIGKYRKDYITDINRDFTKVYHSIAENQDEIRLNYLTEIDSLTENTYLRILEQNYEKDRFLGHTTFGTHKDDFEFIFNTKKANGSASRGEVRSIILALKFIEADIINQTLGEKPIILLDDVFSELDDKRRQCLVSNFKDNQVVITSVENIE